MSYVTEHPDGIYLNMTEDAYYQDPAIGSSALDILRVSPPDYWWLSAYNELAPAKASKDEDATKAMLFGSAVHCCLLEGVEVFNMAYGSLPDKYSHRDALDTADQLKAWLRDKGEKISGSKPELIERILALDPSVQILDVLIEQAKATGRRMISQWDFKRILLMERLLMGPPAKPGEERVLTSLGKAFQGGLSELSVFWTDENGIRQRARFDKLKPNVTIDLKTFSNWKSRDFGKAMLRDAALKGLHVQAAHYEEARRQLRRLHAQGKVFYPTPSNPDHRAKVDRDLDLLTEIVRAEKWRWCWCFYKTDGAPRAKGVVMSWAGEHKGIYDEGCFRRQEALANFVQYREFYGWGYESQMWRDPETLWEPEAADWPIYAQQVD